MALDKIYDPETGCCPTFDPEPWNEKEVTLKEKLFLKEHVFCLFHIPLNMDGVMKKTMEKIAAAQALADKPLMLYDSNSLFGADIYIATSKEVPNTQMTHITGTFLSKVFEGDYSNTGEWIKQMNEYAVSKNKAIKKTYFYYPTCPACAKHYGKNYAVLLAQV
ncbi:hypothetical protein AUJ65_04845 [Candidatus Micrarchaeota archaeon CG1_02_51_15]|nr:MAG: hypothetical protein AUJ65_04845 [Candidatus Micrarchaeota archaeon CG1_02_51_15]